MRLGSCGFEAGVTVGFIIYILSVLFVYFAALMRMSGSYFMNIFIAQFAFNVKCSVETKWLNLSGSTEFPALLSEICFYF